MSVIDVESGNPYRDQSGHFGTSPDAALTDSFKKLAAITFVPKGNGKKESGNATLIKSKKKEAEEALATLRSGGKGDSTTDGSSWKANGTEAEAKDFSKQSKVKVTLYHGTSTKASASIKSKGFEDGHSSALGKSNFGGAIMLTTDQKDAAWYAHRASKTDPKGKVLSVKINTAKLKSMSTDEWDDYEKKAGSNKAAMESVFKDYDAVELKSSWTGETVYMLNDKKKVMTFGENDG